MGDSPITPLSGTWQTAGPTAAVMRGRKNPRSHRAVVACLTCRGIVASEAERERERVARVTREMEVNTAVWLARKGLT